MATKKFSYEGVKQKMTKEQQLEETLTPLLISQQIA
jgi:hypothetical protein